MQSWIPSKCLFYIDVLLSVCIVGMHIYPHSLLQYLHADSISKIHIKILVSWAGLIYNKKVLSPISLNI